MCSPRGSVDCCSVVPIALLLLVKVLHSQAGRLQLVLLIALTVSTVCCMLGLVIPSMLSSCTSSLRRCGISPEYRGGDILYLWIPSNCCCSCCCCCCAMLLTTVYLNLWVCDGAHPGLWSWIVYQGSLPRYHVKVELTVWSPDDLNVSNL